DETLPEGLVLAELRGQHLECNRTAEAQVQSAVNDSHPAAANLRLNLVAGDLVAGREVSRPRVDVLCHCEPPAAGLVGALDLALAAPSGSCQERTSISQYLDPAW